MERKALGRVLIWIGVLAWAPYFGLLWLSEIEPPLWPFLAVHLMGVLGGGWIRGSEWIGRLRKRE